ncbi:hypothetical protein [Mariniblastus fucicola]|uniref:hypothetical protein n=1 Tax=Mariniblastus fucicola TaxID=980251 RepID=UPI0011E02389|nr:hypothetical protein [Mariniblastus fucicola]
MTIRRSKRQTTRCDSLIGQRTPIDSPRTVDALGITAYAIQGEGWTKLDVFIRLFSGGEHSVRQNCRLQSGAWSSRGHADAQTARFSVGTARDEQVSFRLCHLQEFFAKEFVRESLACQLLIVIVKQILNAFS